MQQSKDISQLPFEQLFEMAEEKFNQLDNQQAEYYYELAFNKKPFDDMITMCYAHVLKRNNKPEQAVKILMNSIKSNPNGNYKRYFQLAEIKQGEQSIKIFQQGIAAANKSLSNPFLNTAPQSQIKRDIAQAYASIAQICMTDLINIPFDHVQNKCAEVLQKGKAIDPTCMDVHLQIANCCIEKDNNQLAKNSLLIIKQAVLQQKQEYEDQLVTQCAKLFMEIGEFQHSIDLLEKLNQSQSNDPETVYLMAFCAFQLGQYQACKDYISDYPEGQIIDEQVDDAMKQLKQQLIKKTKKGGEQTQQGNGQEQDWMDVQDQQFDEQEQENQ